MHLGRRQVFSSALVASALAAIIGGGVRSQDIGRAAADASIRSAASGNDKAALPTSPGALASLIAEGTVAGLPVPQGIGGVPPKLYGMSAHCAKVARKTRLRKAGVGGQRQ